MLDDLLAAGLSGDPRRLPALLDTHARRVRETARRGDRGLPARAEAHVARAPLEAFRFDEDGAATLHLGERRFAAGRFEIPTLAELRARAAAHGHRGPARLFVLDGASPVSDIGALQAFAAPDTLFQVASQWNCLEAPSPCLVPVADYLHDPTQGPRAAISALPGTLLRHYAAPGPSGRFTQRKAGPQLNLIEAACAPGVARVECGYLVDHNISDPAAFLRLLDERFEELRVGLHTDVEVVLGYDFDGGVPAAPAPRIHQAFTSAIAGGGYGRGVHGQRYFVEVATRLQRAAQLGTLLGAVACGARRAVLTLIGGGVFGNPRGLVFSSIVAAFDALRADGYALDVVVNGRDLTGDVPAAELRARTAERGGCLVEVR